ncbi:MAG: hypothetical protein IPK82_32085 [Polyangiaceae bacterium]|nr:hypothetical protein [Polyangiaceae bacterium]
MPHNKPLRSLFFFYCALDSRVLAALPVLKYAAYVPLRFSLGRVIRAARHEKKQTPSNKVFSLVGLGAIALFSTAPACNNDNHACIEYCERIIECDSSAATTQDACVEQCNGFVEDAQDLGCGPEYQEQLECFGHASQICDQGDLFAECTVQISAYQSCLGPK